jgi:hypothetical protein
MSHFSKAASARDMRVTVPAKALDAIFDECDRFEMDETGGRLIGSFSDVGGKLSIDIAGVIEPGPDARRSKTSFFQDGAHQESVFRELERVHPEIEHLGNWHTHHVNGLASLSGGDIQTYQRTVNHPKHNTPFFYALLVTNRERQRGKERYRVKHYVLHRGDPSVYEIDRRQVVVTDAPILWPRSVARDVAETSGKVKGAIAPPVQGTRAYDVGVLREMYSRVRSFMSPSVGLYWRGAINLVDGSNVEVVVVESAGAGGSSYTIGLPSASGCLSKVGTEIDGRQFSSATSALIFAERACNHALYAHVNRLRSSEKGG